jgi:2-methylcitrate dehydratase
MKTVAEQLSLFAAGLDYSDLPSEVVHEVKRRVIDALGCALGADGSPPAVMAQRLARLVKSRRGATLLGTGWKSSPELAAFVNGILVRYLDYNDTYLSKEPAHPSDNIPAALAIAEAEGADGRRLIEAIVIGYEVQCRLCDAASLRARGWDHVTYGSLSSGLLSAKLMGLPKEQMVQTLGLAGTPNIALRQTRVGELSMWKGCAFAHAARNGIFAAQLAREGMTGPAPFFEGERGFFRQVSGPFELPAFGGDGRPFMILKTSLKFYPAEYHAQSAIEAALALRGEVGDLKQIRSITIKTFQAAFEIIGHEPEKWRPQSRETADHSLPYCVAVALVDGRVGLRQFEPERFRDPELLALMRKIEVKRDEALDRDYPEGIPNLVEITLASGRVLTKRVTYPRGGPRNPFSDGEVEEKFKSLASGRLSSTRIKRLLGRLWGLESMKDLGEIGLLMKITQKGD